MQTLSRKHFELLATPLASIFGSGFLVIVPVLAQSAGPYMAVAMAAVCLLAYLVGSVIRHNIRVAEPLLADGQDSTLNVLERSADISIVVAYVISITLYLHILASFVLSGIGQDIPLYNNLLTSAIIIVIAGVGVWRGLGVLGFMEKWALYVTFVLIALVLAGFALFDFQAWQQDALQIPAARFNDLWQTCSIIAGTLIVVQGFETPRYLGEQYPADLRIQASRQSQLISASIYILFVLLAMPLVPSLNGVFDDHSLITLAGLSAFGFLPAAVIFAAVLSQFSAAVADTLAASGNLSEISAKRISAPVSYLLIAGFALLLTWSADTFEILALASRAFAAYYALQCLVAWRATDSVRIKTGSLILAAIMLYIVIFAVPVG
ncbi:hypothetical protein [Aliamphritea hakodatensis]|uniref:hypothetical protein n=1 Tax=Aliamphritea hakodatensis TaxID=2895352 RepID=UPI0022FD5264|nr:hypothetical protein [Aliamphritea hakodatensis]